MKNNLIVSALTMLVLGSIATYSAPSVFADWLIDRSGTLIQVDGLVLGDDSIEEDENETNNRETEQKREMVKDQVENARESAKQNAETKREMLKKQTETKIKANEQKVESLKTRAKYELKNNAGTLEIKGEIKDKNDRVVGSPTAKTSKDESVAVEQEDERGNVEQVRINAVKDGQLELVKKNIRTTSEYELNIGEKNEISVTLPNGKTRELALPDKALENLVAKGVLTSTEGEDGASSYELTAGKSGEPVYQVEGKVEKKFLGLLKLKFDQRLEVAASVSEDGTTLAGDIVSSESRETSTWRRFLERLSR